MATHAQGVIPTQTDLHRSTSRVLVALFALVAVTVVAIMSWSAMTRVPSTSSTGAPQEAYDWSASRPGGSIYGSQVPEQAAENSAALRPGGSVYDSQVPPAARDDS